MSFQRVVLILTSFFKGKDRDLRKWAVEGLSFLSLDASVKEKLCEDEPAVRALVELAKSGRQVSEAFVSDLFVVEN